MKRKIFARETRGLAPAVIGALCLCAAMFILSISPAWGQSGQATLAWNAPTTNVDGTALTDLAGYTVYYGTSPIVSKPQAGIRTRTVPLSDAGLSCGPAGGGGQPAAVECRYTVPGLPAGMYHFRVTAFNESRNESDYSNEVTKKIE